MEQHDTHTVDTELQPMHDEASPSRLCTIRCPLLHVAPFATSASAASVLSASQAALLVVELIEHVCAQLQLTPASCSDMDEMRGQIEAHRAAGHSVSAKCRPFLEMLRGMAALQRTVQRAFVPPPGLRDTSRCPRVQQVLLMFGSSLHSPLLIFRLHVAYEQRASADDTRQTQVLCRAMVRQLIQHSALLFPSNLPAGLHSANLRLHTLIQFDRHADASLSIEMPLSAPADEDSLVDASVAIRIDFSEYAGVQFKPDYAPKLLNSYSFAAPPSPRSAADSAPDAAAASSAAPASSARRVRRVKLFRIPKPKAPLPLTILLGTAEQTAQMAASYDEGAPESLDLAGVWYQCQSSIAFSRRLPPLPQQPSDEN